MTETGESGARLSRYAASRADIETLVARLAEPRYRADQIWDGLWRRRCPLAEITDLPATLRHRLATELPSALDEAVVQTGDAGMTLKWLWRCTDDGAQVETVLMRYENRATVCVSSQAGCAMGCTFCATGQAGFERHLSVGEIVEQVVRAQHACPERVSNVVFMGMGEPLANVDPVLGALDRLHDGLGISARSLTVSTVGVVPGMRRLAEYPLPVTLAVSLHAADDDHRQRLVPLNRRYPIADVVAAAREYAEIKGRRVTFEYACIAGENDSIDEARRLGGLLRGLRGGAHVNLIPLNATAGFAGAPADAARIAAFADELRQHGVNATIRHNRGTDIDAACGQLRSRAETGRRSARMEP